MNKKPAVAVVGVACFLGLVAWWLLPPGDGVRGDVALVESSSPERVNTDVETFRTQARVIDLPELPTEEIGTTEASAETPPMSFRVTVLHGDGEPAAGAIAVLAQDGNPVERVVTDAQGVAEFTAREDAGVVTVGGATLGMDSFELEACLGNVELRLPHGDRDVRGVVLLDGSPASIPLGLLPRTRKTGVPWMTQTWLALSQLGVARTRLEHGQYTGVDGTFRFSALPADWKGRFSFGLAYALADNSDGWARPNVPASPDLVLLELRSVPVIHGRVVEADGSTPAVGAVIEAEIKHRSSGMGETWRTDEVGGFAIPVADGPAVEFSAVFASVDGQGRATIDVGEVSDEVDYDLGTIVLRELRAVTFEVTDEAGDPVAGARVVVASGEPSEPTDALGIASVDAQEGQALQDVEVWAHTFAFATLDVPASSEHVHVTLSRCATLDVVVEGDARGCSAHLTVEGGPDAQLDRGDARRLVIEDATGVPETALRRTSINRKPAGNVLRYDVDIEGSRAIFSCLPAGAPMVVSIHDRSGSPIWTKPMTLGVGEQRHLVASLPESVQLMGRVLDPNGRAIEGAEITLKPSPASGKKVTRGRSEPDGVSDVDGRFSIDEVRASTITAVIEAPGFVRAQLSDIPRPTGEWVVALEQGREVEAVFVDAAGNPEPVRSVSVFEGEDALDVEIVRPEVTGDFNDAAARRLGSSRRTIRDLPQRDIRFVAWRENGPPIEAVLPASAERVVIELPATGTLEVTFDSPHTVVELSLQVEGEDNPRRVRADDIGRVSFGSIPVGKRKLTLQRRPHGERNAPWTPLATATVIIEPSGVHAVEF